MQTYSRIHISFGFAKRSILLLAAIVLSLTFAGNARAAGAETGLHLLMFEEAGCMWCARWNEEVGPEYPITPEGIAAPLRRIDLHRFQSSDYELTSRPRFTPTFILVSDGQEVGRIEGYPGEDFFWGLLGRLLQQAEPES